MVSVQRRRLAVAAAVAVASLGWVAPQADGLVAAPLVARVSVADNGSQASEESDGGSISADGRYVVFDTNAPGLVPGDSGYNYDVFMRDRVLGTTTRISETPVGGTADSHSFRAVITPDGNHVLFESRAKNLTGGADTNQAADLFVWTRSTDTITRASLTSTGGELTIPGIEDDPDLAINQWGIVTSEAISADGRFVAFTSNAANIVPDDTNDERDVFLRDLVAGTTVRVSTAVGGGAPDGASEDVSISGDGRYVAYSSTATNLVPGSPDETGVFVLDRQTGTTTRLPATGGATLAGRAYEPKISADGAFIAYGVESSEDLVAGAHTGSVQLVMWARSSGTASPVTAVTDWTDLHPKSISGDGRYLAFQADFPSVVADDTNDSSDGFVWDRQTSGTARVTVADTGVEANGNAGGETEFSRGLYVSADGTYVGFASSAADIVAGDSNAAADVFVWQRDGVAASAGPAPVATTAPVVTGSASSGSTLEASVGVWDQAGLSYRFRWLLDGQPISDSTVWAGDYRYTVRPSDVGHDISVRVRATKQGHALGFATSTPLVVASGSLSNTAKPTIAGTAQVDRPLTATPGSWNPTPDAYGYQWFADGTPVAGATTASFTPRAAQARRRISVQVTASRSGLPPASASSLSSAAVLPGVLRNSAVPTITGQVKVGKKLTATAGAWTPRGVTLRYQWLRGGKVIAGATGKAFKLKAASRGKRISVRVTATLPGYSALSATSKATRKVS